MDEPPVIQGMSISAVEEEVPVMDACSKKWVR
ncbi:hypothetical protein C5167_025089 [Papaver somniferum]|uniref:Uncharacterized protein n=1 Tax=Papaver somniferum TaxID=3469 RepID=A0A4Y7JQE4_PAPSO|nr:hypothetical protein C5167_025089 [Papaver somniferum]